MNLISLNFRMATALSLILVLLVPASVLASTEAAGAELTEAPDNAPYVGVDDTTVLIYAMLAHCEGEDSAWGRNMNFPHPDSGKLSCNEIGELWHQYFWLCRYYELTLVRIGASDSWGTRVMFEAWRDHPSSFGEVISSMLHEAAEHGVMVCLVMAGSQEHPLYAFGGWGSVLDTSSQAYGNYIQYCAGVMAITDSCEESSALFSYDCWNEPDHLSVNAAHWHGDQLRFRSWAQAVSSDLCPLTEAMVEMGTGGYTGQGGLWETWGLSSFLNITGLTGFDACHLHYYASVEDEYLVSDPLNWSAYVGKPLHWGELARNDVYPLQRWTWFEERLMELGADAWCNMVLRGTPGYPFTSTIPADEEPPSDDGDGPPVDDGNTTDPVPPPDDGTDGNTTDPEPPVEDGPSPPDDNQTGTDQASSEPPVEDPRDRGTYPGEVGNSSAGGTIGTVPMGAGVKPSKSPAPLVVAGAIVAFLAAISAAILYRRRE